MISYDSLKKILAMDFRKMRALEVPGGFCASDEAIALFVNGFFEFFTQFQQAPDCFQLEKYKHYLEEMVSKINTAEQEYYEKKYISEDIEPAIAKSMAASCCLKGLACIPERMQYWAMSETWGNTIRNAGLHVHVIKQMQAWSKMIDGLAYPLFLASALNPSSGHKNPKPKPVTLSFSSAEQGDDKGDDIRITPTI